MTCEVSPTFTNGTSILAGRCSDQKSQGGPGPSFPLKLHVQPSSQSHHLQRVPSIDSGYFSMTTSHVIPLLCYCHSPLPSLISNTDTAAWSNLHKKTSPEVPQSHSESKPKSLQVPYRILYELSPGYTPPNPPTPSLTTLAPILPAPAILTHLLASNCLHLLLPQGLCTGWSPFPHSHIHVLHSAQMSPHQRASFNCPKQNGSPFPRAPFPPYLV